MSKLVPDGWRIGTLNEFASIKGGKRLPKGEQFSPIKTAYPYVRVTDFKSGSVDQSNLRYVSKLIRDKIKRYVISSKDLYISIAGTLGIVGEVPEKLDGALLTENAAKIIFNSPQVSDKKFFKYYLNSIEAQEQFNQSKGTGGGVPKLALFRIEDTLVLAPPLPEQQKIAAILTSVDEVIEKTAAQIAKLKDLKTAMMQELLTRGVGVDGKPHREFKDSPVGRIPKGWEVVPLGDKAKIIPGYAFSSTDFVPEGVPLIRMGNLYQNQLSLDRAPKYMPIEFIDKHPKFVVRANDIVFSMTGTSGKEDYGFAVKIPEIAPICFLNQRVAKIVGGKEVNMNFLLNLMRSRLFLDEIYAVGAGTKQANLSSSNILCINLPFPPIKEQIKIANALDAVSDRISVINAKLKQLKNTKKALMQDLLTGKVRVKVAADER